MSHGDKLFDFRMADGSRHFADVPWLPPLLLKQRLEANEGVRVTGFLDGIDEAWIDFEYGGHSFTAHNPLNEYCLFVHDPFCPGDLLSVVTKLVT